MVCSYILSHSSYHDSILYLLCVARKMSWGKRNPLPPVCQAKKSFPILEMQTSGTALSHHYIMYSFLMSISLDSGPQGGAYLSFRVSKKGQAMRQDGFYWVKLSDMWIIALWDSGCKEWQVAGSTTTWIDEEFEKIDENRLEYEL